MTPRPAGTIFDAIYQAGHFGDATIKQASAAMGVPEGRLYDAVDPSRPRPFRVEWIVPFTNITKHDAIVHFICRSVGGLFVRLPKGGGRLTTLASAAGEVAKEFADVMKEFGASLDGDHRLDRSECTRVVQQLDELIERATAMRELLARHEDNEVPARGLVGVGARRAR